MPVSAPSTRPGNAVRRYQIRPRRQGAGGPGGAPGRAVGPETAAPPAVRIGPVDLEWVRVVSDGWASTLRRFMRENEYLQSLHFNSLRLRDGSVVNISLPIVLSIIDADREAIGDASDIALVCPGGDFVAILRSIEIYKHNKEEKIARTWGIYNSSWVTLRRQGNWPSWKLAHWRRS